MQCNYCLGTFPNFKSILDHYEVAHREFLKRYSVIHKGRDAQGIVRATSVGEACRFFGWQVNECKIKVLNEEPDDENRNETRDSADTTETEDSIKDYKEDTKNVL